MNKKTSKKHQNQHQNQCQVDKQKQEQVQDQIYSNETLCKLMTTMEGIFKRETNQNLHGGLFDYYDPMKSKKVKTIEELYTQADILIMLFSTSHQLYVQKYQKYDLPKNLDSTYLLKILGGMGLSPKLKPLIENLMHILNQEYHKVTPIMEEYQQSSESINLDYKTLCKDIPMIWANSHEIGKKVMQDYEKDPQGYVFEAQLNKDGSLNPLAQKEKQIYSGLDFTQGPQGLIESYNLRQQEKENNPQSCPVTNYSKEKQNKDLGECKKSTNHKKKCQCEQSVSSHLGDHHNLSNEKLDIPATSQREYKTYSNKKTQTNHVNDHQKQNYTSMCVETSHDQKENNLQNTSTNNITSDSGSRGHKMKEEKTFQSN